MVGSALGKFGSRLEMFPASGGRNICYRLSGRRDVDPAMGVCFSPSSPFAPAETAGEHFSVVALESATDGEVTVQVFGVAFDDVVALRVNVSGNWYGIPVQENGFYREFRGVHHEEAGIVEATLEDGTVQRHDIQTGSRVT